MKYIIFLIIMQISTFGYLSAQQVDTIEFNYFKIVDDALPYAETFLGCGVSEEGYFSLGTSVVNHTKYLSLKKYIFTGELLADLELDNENEGYGQVNYGRCLAQVNDTEWVLAYRGIANDENSDIRVIRFNLEGEVLWKTDLGASYTDNANQLIVTNDEKIVVIGERFLSNSTYLKKAYLAILNESGELQIEHLDETDVYSDLSTYTSIIELGTNLFVSGRKEFGGVYYAFVNKFNSLGNIYKEQIFEEDEGCNCNLYSINDNIDEFYYLACHLDNEILHRGIIDTSLNFKWEKFVNFDEYYETAPVTPIIYSDRRYISIDEYYEFHPQYGYLTQLQLFGLDPEGNLEFVTKIPTDLGKEVYARDLRKTPDGGYLIAGYEHFPSPQRGWLIKTDSLGNTCQLPNCDSLAYVIDTVFTSNFDITTAQSGVKIFPNPTQKNGFVNVVLNDNYNAIESSQIFSIDGKQLFFSANRNTSQVPTSNLVAGIYMLKIRTRKGVTYTRRLVVK